jgi:hypothetical protein
MKKRLLVLTSSHQGEGRVGARVLADALATLLDASKHGEAAMQYGASARMLGSACRSELNNL